MNPRRALSLLLGAVVLALVFSPPHRHDASHVSHPAHACRVCKIQDGFSASPPDPSPALVEAVPGRLLVWQPLEAPRASTPRSSSTPRSPPRLT
jgi:hypothetical protein